MGLDMYLSKINSDVLAYKDIDMWDLKNTSPSLYEKLEPYILKTKYGNFDTLTEEVGYWRKANAIHGWFVDNVQSGCDDCESYLVTKEQLEELLDVCKTVRESIVLVDGEIQNGWSTNKNGALVENTERGKRVLDTTVAEELLPTLGGFFFGGTDYDQWYVDDIEHTIDVLEKVLKDTDFEQYSILYQSSW